MKLLIITQKVDINDDNLGFFHRWLEKFSEKLEKLYVVCLWEGKHNLFDNVQVYSLGKEKGYSKIRQMFRLQKFLLKNLKDIDGVFVHMCPIYVIASFPLVKLFRKKMVLWYLHKSINWKLKSAGRLARKILTASPESCRLKNRKKIEVVGHGIDVRKFKIQNHKSQTKPTGREADSPEGCIQNTKYKILSAGRISPVKDQMTLIQAIDILVHEKNISDIEVEIIGIPLEDYEKEYFVKLKNLVQEKKLGGNIRFSGSVLHKNMPQHYQNADIFINLSHTGSIDKVVLEAMACGSLILTCNEAFEKILDNRYLFFKKNPQDLAKKIIILRGKEKDVNLRDIVVEYHNLDNLINKIISEF